MALVAFDHLRYRDCRAAHALLALPLVGPLPVDFAGILREAIKRVTMR
jgi:hypothetical protein